jgi:hypothetical protein
LLIQIILLKNVITAGKQKKIEQNEGRRTGSNSDNLLNQSFFFGTGEVNHYLEAGTASKDSQKMILC